MLGSSSQASIKREAADSGESLAFTDHSTGERYSLVRPLGRGGMGETYEARRLHAGCTRPCVVKFCRRDRRSDPASQARFEREAAFGWEVTHDHPNLVTTYRSGIWRCSDPMFHGQPFLVLEFVDGPHLRAVSHELSQRPALLRRVMRDVLSALAHLHQRQVVHCDVSLRNILIGRNGGRNGGSNGGSNGIVKLADLGLAQHDASHNFDGSHGVVAFASPEVLFSGLHTFESDLYSLGAAIYALITGDGPYGSGDPIQVAARMKRWPQVLIPKQVPEDLAALLTALLRHEQRERPLASEALTMLEASGAPIASDDQLADLAQRWRTEGHQSLTDGRRGAPTPLATSPAAEPDHARDSSGAIARPQNPRKRRITEPLTQPPTPSDINLLLLAAIQAEDTATTTTFEREHEPSQPGQPQSPLSRRWKWAATIAGLISCLVLVWRTLDHTKSSTASGDHERETAAATSVLTPADRSDPDHNSRNDGESDGHNSGEGHNSGDETRTNRQMRPSRQSRPHGLPQGYIPLELTTAKPDEQTSHTSATQDDHDTDE